MPEWPQMRRADLLREDLAAMGVEAPHFDAELALASEAEVMGALYVLEGSRLGGKLLRRSVASGLPTRYLDHQAPLPWPVFVTQIERMLSSGVGRREAAGAANRVFGVFEGAARLA